MTGCKICNSRKPKRVTNQSGGGSGKEAFSSGLFRAVHWNMSRQDKQTSVSFRPDYHSAPVEVRVAGHITIKSEAACIALFNPREQLRIIVLAMQAGERKGRAKLQAQFSELMEVRRW